MIISSLYNILNEKDEKTDNKIDEPDMGDNEETDEKNQDNTTGDEPDTTADDDELFNDVDNEMDEGNDTATDGDESNDVDPDSTSDSDAAEDDTTDDGVTDDTSEDTSEEDPKYIKIKEANKKKKLAMDIINLYDYYGKIIYRLEDLTNLAYDESKIIDDCIRKMSETRKLMYDYIQTMYRSDSYERALSMYMSFRIPIKFTEEIIAKIAEKRNNI